MQLVIGNKNYSSWSLRPWLLLRQLGIPFEERMLRFDSFAPGSRFATEAAKLGPTAKVPVLIEDDGFTTWDTLAIVERVADLFPEAGVWPVDAKARARARSLAASMHSGLGSLRSLCPMNVEADLRAVGQRLLASEPGLTADLAALQSWWTPALEASGGPLLFGDRFCAADAFFAPVALRVTRYGLPLSPRCAAYVDALLDLPAMQTWVAEAMAEKDFVVEDEPYRSGPDEGARFG